MTVQPETSVAALRERLGSPSVIILDVRTPGEFESGHIPGALNVPVDQLAAHAPRFPETLPREVVLVCQSGGRATAAQQHVPGSVLTGGMTAWTASGGSTTSASGTRWAMERQVRFTAGSLVLSGILGSLIWPRARFLAGAIGAGLVFSAVSNTCAMGTLLGKLPYNRASSGDVEVAVSRLSS
ncbi:rhodanese-like domain-containing protein [Pseudonocardia spinosispora]|uniref:rhodanese-like domain-containing protein n=1 Tax=Pseudonocardia spinosispora TaxID=103441 RepID=UPI0003FDEB4B|nr:rhodanese-like domain-containing protein [Pseudonocardia spinosispora]